MKHFLSSEEASKITSLEFECFQTSFGPSVLIEYCYRPFVCVKDSENHILPFWMSTGRGKKKDVQQGKWYPIVGMSHKWINKYDSKSLTAYYNSAKLKNIANLLDSNFKCLNIDGSRNYDFDFSIPVLEIDFLVNFITLINTNSPNPCVDNTGDVKITINSFLESIGEEKYF